MITQRTWLYHLHHPLLTLSSPLQHPLRHLSVVTLLLVWGDARDRSRCPTRLTTHHRLLVCDRYNRLSVSIVARLASLVQTTYFWTSSCPYPRYRLCPRSIPLSGVSKDLLSALKPRQVLTIRRWYRFDRYFALVH